MNSARLQSNVNHNSFEVKIASMTGYGLYCQYNQNYHHLYLICFLLCQSDPQYPQHLLCLTRRRACMCRLIVVQDHYSEWRVSSLINCLGSSIQDKVFGASLCWKKNVENSLTKCYFCIQKSHCQLECCCQSTLNHKELKCSIVLSNNKYVRCSK